MYLESVYVLLMSVLVDGVIITSSNPVPVHMVFTEAEVNEHCSETFTVRNKIQCAGSCLKVKHNRANNFRKLIIDLINNNVLNFKLL